MVAITTTPDGVIADNITRLRENKKDWTQTELAKNLRVSKHVVLDYEGRRKGRRQRPFRWSELIELCYLLDVTLYELVLPPDRDTRIDVSESEALGELPAVEVSLGNPGSKDLGLRLFGVPGDDLLEADKLKKFAGIVAYASDRRRENLKKFEEAIRTLAQDLVDSGFRTLREAIDDEE